MKVLGVDVEAAETLEAEVLALRRAEGAPHVVQLLGLISVRGNMWLAMELVPGREIFEMLDERGAIAPEFCQLIVRQLLNALDALSRLSVVHRDVKPENLMVSEDALDGGLPRLTLIDFGYAAVLGDEGSLFVSGCSGVAGSPEYAAPEVLAWVEVEADETGKLVGVPYDAKCDVWSLGVTAHCLIRQVPSTDPCPHDNAMRGNAW